MATTTYVSAAKLARAVGVRDESDELLLLAQRAASRRIDTSTGRRFWLDDAPATRTYRVARRVVDLDDCGGHLLYVDDFDPSGPLTVEVGGVTSWTTVTGYELYPDNCLADGVSAYGLVLPTGRWYGPRARVTARHGWPTVPDVVEEACLLQAGRVYHRKDSPEGVVGSAEWGSARVSRADPDVEDMLAAVTLTGF